MSDKDKHMCVLDKEGNSVRQGQRYVSGGQGDKQRVTRTEIYAPNTKKATVVDKDRHIRIGLEY